MSLAIKLQAATTDFQKLQADMAKAVDARQKLEAQLSENELVKKVRKYFASTAPFAEIELGIR